MASMERVVCGKIRGGNVVYGCCSNLTENHGRSMSKRRGFTLIELLVVIAIIALLLSIMLPSLKTAKDVVKATICQSQLNSLGKGFHFYWDEWDGRNPPRWWKDGTTEPFPAAYTMWPWFMQKVYEVSLGPADSTPTEKYDAVRKSKMFNCPSAYEKDVWILDTPPCSTSAAFASGTSYDPVCYSINRYISDPNVEDYYPKVQRCQRLAELGLLSDGARMGFISYSTGVSQAMFTYEGNVNVEPRHPGQTSNQLLADLHVEPVSYYKFWFDLDNYLASGNLYTDIGVDYWGKPEERFADHSTP